MKKVLVAALFCAASTFASWDKFPVIEDGKGEAKFGVSQSREVYSKDGGYDFKVRYSPLANLELMSTFSEGIYGTYILGARYQIIPVLSAGVDVGFPIPGTAWGFTPNVQFSLPITEALALGSNVEVTINTEDATKIAAGMDLSAGIELDLTIGKSTIWVSCDVNTGLTPSKYDGKVGKGPDGKDLTAKDEGRGLEIAPSLGYIATVGNLALGTNIGWEFGKDAGHVNSDDKSVPNTIIGVDFSVKF